MLPGNFYLSVTLSKDELDNALLIKTVSYLFKRKPFPPQFVEAEANSCGII